MSTTTDSPEQIPSHATELPVIAHSLVVLKRAS